VPVQVVCTPIRVTVHDTDVLAVQSTTVCVDIVSGEMIVRTRRTLISSVYFVVELIVPDDHRSEGVHSRCLQEVGPFVQRSALSSCAPT
jgi:hypothetical protein